MERLTMRNLDGKAFARGERPGEAQPAVRILPELLESLAKYEDTGLTPEEINKLDTQRKAMAALADSYKAEIPQWIPVTEKMPMERNSIVPGLGTVSKPVLVTWMDPTSDKTYPDNCFVREGITRNGEFTLQHTNGDLIPIAWMPQLMPYEPPKEVPQNGNSEN